MSEGDLQIIIVNESGHTLEAIEEMLRLSQMLREQIIAGAFDNEADDEA